MSGPNPHYQRLSAFICGRKLPGLALWGVLLAVVAHTRADPDLWGHVLFGQNILRELAIPPSDPYSFTADRIWVNHEWAAEVLIGAAYSLASNPGLILLKVATIAAALLVLASSLRLQGVESYHCNLICAFAAIASIQQINHIRPQVFSVLFFSVLLWALVAATRRDARPALVLPPLFAIWVNAHGGWIVGGGVLMLWTATMLVTRRDRSAVSLLGFGVVGLIATVTNPYGTAMWRFLYETVGITRADIADWQPVYALGPAVWVLWLGVALAATMGAVRWWRSGAQDVARVVVVGALAVGSFQVNRLLVFFALATAFLLGPWMAQMTAARSRGARPDAPVRTGVAVALVLAVLISAAGALVRNLSCIRIDPRLTPERDVVTTLKRQNASGRLLVWFGWGEYAIWHLAPHLRVSVDGRRETIYSSSVQQKHLRFYFDLPGGADLPNELAADYVWIPRNLPIVSRLRRAGWNPLIVGDQSIVFSRTPAVTTHLQASEDPRCFPGS